MFGRVTITLGMGPHSSFMFVFPALVPQPLRISGTQTRGLPGLIIFFILQWTANGRDMLLLCPLSDINLLYRRSYYSSGHDCMTVGITVDCVLLCGLHLTFLSFPIFILYMISC